MSDTLSRAADRLRGSHARAIGALSAARSLASEQRGATVRSAQTTRERDQAIARNRAAQEGVEHSLRARDLGSALVAAATTPLDVAEYISLGRLSLAGAPLGVNENVDVPFILPLIGCGNIVIEATSPTARHLVEQVVLRALEGTAPGQLDVLGYDPGLTSVLSAFSPLRRISEGSLKVVSSAADLDREMQRLVGEVQRVNDTLRGVSPSLVEFRRAVGHPVERYRLVVMLGTADIDVQLRRRILTLAGAGADAGVSFVFVLNPGDDDNDDLRSSGTVLREDGDRVRWNAHPDFEVLLPQDSDSAVARSVDRLAAQAASAAAPRIPFERVQPLERTWQESSADRLRFAIGLAGPAVAELTLGDDLEQRHNVLITGAVGQGKSNLLKVVVHSLAQRYAPEELELHLLDFKEGVTLYPLAPTPGAPDFLPHARVLGLESDREFGLAVLRHLEAEFMRRAKLFRPHGDSIARYRAAVPEAQMPRIVVVIDEFHLLFDPNDKTAEVSAQLLEAIARRGRSYGIHLILASQTVSGVAALMTREGGIFSQFPIRLALKNSAQESFATLGLGNDAAARVRFRGEAVLNLDYGEVGSNRTVTIAAADDAELAVLRHGWWEAARTRVSEPVVFDGGRRRRIAEATADLRGLRARATVGGGVTAPLGYPIDVAGRPAFTTLTAEPGRNVALLGAGDRPAEEADEPVNVAIGTLQAAAIAIALQHPQGDAEFVSLDLLDAETLERNGHDRWLGLMAALGFPVERVGREDVAAYFQRAADGLEERSADGPARYLFGFGLDRATAFDVPDMFAHRPADDLQRVIRSGPPTRTHLLGWWANAATFKAHIGFGGEGFIDTMLMLRIDQGSVQELLSSPFVVWSPRDNRGLLADRTQLPEPLAIIPFSPLTVRDAAELARTDWDAGA
jgi:S-DNA-T family DNA segregation ATPase FtsK/SpoIIIE